MQCPRLAYLDIPDLLVCRVPAAVGSLGTLCNFPGRRVVASRLKVFSFLVGLVALAAFGNLVMHCSRVQCPLAVSAARVYLGLLGFLAVLEVLGGLAVLGGLVLLILPVVLGIRG